MNNVKSERNQRVKPFLQDRFGMFIHWGLYAIPARGEWVRSTEKIAPDRYMEYFRDFNPTEYDPRKWAKLAKAAGMKYAVMTTKHHDGFCLFDSKLTDFKATNTQAKRDLTREYVDAFRAEGIKVGFYYSLLDWNHPGYPAFGDSHHPQRTDEAYNTPRDFESYIQYLHGQVRELCTNYGKIDIMWFDFSYGEMSGEKWHATELVNMVRELQPGILIDNRLGGHIKSAEPEVYSGDFASPEQIIPPEGMLDDEGDSLPWEACITLNGHWGYAAWDWDYKSPQQVVRTLVECVSKNGNLLLNVGPDAKGNIPDESIAILEEVGRWMDKNGRSIYGCGNAGLPKPEWGRYTRNGNSLFAHIYDRGIGSTNLRQIGREIQAARLLADHSEVEILKPWNASDYPDDTFINLKSQMLPCELDTVVELILK